MLKKEKKKKPPAPRTSSPSQNPKKLKYLIFWLFLGVMVVYYYFGRELATPPPRELMYSELIEYAETGRIVKLEISDKQGTGQFRDDTEYKEFTVTLPENLPDSFFATPAGA